MRTFRDKLKTTGSFAVLSIAAAMAATPVFAAEADTYQVEEVVITANKRGAESVQDVGTSIGVLGEEALAQRDITQIIDITRNVAGLNVVDQGPGQKTFMIRGLIGAGESTVGLYYDNLPTNGSGESAAASSGRQTDLYVFDAERVEVLRGPQSTLYGSSALAGVVRIITKEADASALGGQVVVDGSSTAHGGSNYALKGMLNLPIVEDKLAVRLVAYKTRDGGFIDNTYLNRKDVNNVDNVGFRLNTKAWLGDHTTLTGQLFVQEIEAQDKPTHRPYDEVIGATVYRAAGELRNDAKALQPRTDHTVMGGLTLEHEFENANLTISQAYFKRKNTDAADASELNDYFGYLVSQGNFPPVPRMKQGIFQSGQETEMWTSEARVATKLDGPLNGVFGVMYQDRKIQIDNRFREIDNAGRPIDTVALWYNRTADFQLKQIAAFGEATYEFNDKLSILGGIRVFKNERHDISTSVVPFMRVLGQAGAQDNVTSKESKAIYKAQVTYKANEDMMFYASVSEGYRAGGTVVRVVEQLPESYGADYTLNYEAGVKSDWFDRRLQANLSVYRINWYDMQYSGSFFNGTFEGVLNCEGKCAHSQGVELDLHARPMQGLDLTVAATAFKAELDKQLINGEGDPLAGTQLRNTPSFSFSTSGSYTWELSNGLTAMVRADVQHVGKVPITHYRIADNRPGKAYTLVNAAASIASGERWDVKLYVRNLFDKAAEVNVANDATTPYLIYTNQPRTVGVSLGVKY